MLKVSESVRVPRTDLSMPKPGPVELADHTIVVVASVESRNRYAFAWSLSFKKICTPFLSSLDSKAYLDRKPAFVGAPGGGVVISWIDAPSVSCLINR